MNVKICDCGKAVWASDKYCVCGRAYEDIKPKPYEGAYERYINGDYEKVTDEEIDAWFKRWQEKYNIP